MFARTQIGRDLPGCGLAVVVITMFMTMRATIALKTALCAISVSSDRSLPQRGDGVRERRWGERKRERMG